MAQKNNQGLQQTNQMILTHGVGLWGPAIAEMMIVAKRILLKLLDFS